MQDLIDEIKLTELTLKLPPDLWESFDPPSRTIITEAQWTTFKFLTANNALSNQINNVSNQMGGIYLFYVSPEIIPYRQRVLLYVGRSKITTKQNLRKRISEYYFNYINNKSDRPKINQMFTRWGKFIYCSYIELSNNALIEQLEAELINKLLPPFNSVIPDKRIGLAVRAQF